jgi:hypothetical protein
MPQYSTSEAELVALRTRLHVLGLAEYFDRMVNEGFTSWDVVLLITPSDL